MTSVYREGKGEALTAKKVFTAESAEIAEFLFFVSGRNSACSVKEPGNRK
jgi:hypothetical protein